MPIEQCTLDGKPGYCWGSGGKCYTYTEGDDASAAEAKRKATSQGQAAHASGFKESADDWGDVVELQEIALAGSDLHVDREAGVIHGVRILGPDSRNHRRYTPTAIAKAKGMYEDRQVNIDHPQGKGSQRVVADRFGWLKDVREQNGGLTGDLHYLKTHALAGPITEAADRHPVSFGLSHNADGRVVRRGNEHVVEEIIGVRSVDVVADPATTKSLFESEETSEQKAESTPDRLDAFLKEIRSLIREAIMPDPVVEPTKEEPAVEPVKEEIKEEPKPNPTQESLAALQEELKGIKATLAEVQQTLKAPIGRPRSSKLKEATGDYQAPKDTAEVVKRLKGR